MALDGNIINYGADPTGVADSGPAFQSLFNDDPMGYVPPGLYRIATSSICTRPKIVECAGKKSIASGYDGSDGLLLPIRADEQARFIIEVPYPFIIDQQQFHWTGGCFDRQAQTGAGAIFQLRARMIGELITNRTMGWGFDFDDITVLGNYSELRDITQGVSSTARGTSAIHVKFLGETLNWAFMYQLKSRMQVFGCEVGIRIDPPDPAVTGQHCSGFEVYVNAMDTRCSVWDQGSSRNTYYVDHHAGPVFPNSTLANNTASVITDANSTHPWNRFYNFGAADVGGYSQNAKTYNTTGTAERLYPSQDSLDRAIDLGPGNTLYEYNNIRFQEGSGVQHYNATTAELEDIAHPINTKGKRRGAPVYNTDTGMLVHANSISAGSAWLHPVTAAIVHTPS